MGSNYSSQRNLCRDCTSLQAIPNVSIARWGDSFEISMGTWKENYGRTEFWIAVYQTGPAEHFFACSPQLKVSHDYNGVESIYFECGDCAAEIRTVLYFALKMTRVGLDGLAVAITRVSGAAPVSFTRAAESSTIETTIVSYGCSQRYGLFVLEMKKKFYCQYAYMVTLAHYYVTKDVGLSVTATICRNKNGNGFGVEVEGPFKHPSADLRNVIVMTCRTGVWSPNACSHCYGVPNNSLLKAYESSHQGQEAVGQVVRHPVFSSNIGEQHYKGLINSSGYTTGSPNHSIIMMLFKNCYFKSID